MRIIVTGGPGAGKTALLTGLAARGCEYVAETARAVIQDRKRRGLSPRPDPADFAGEILRIDLERYRDASAPSGRIFFDRGIPDALGMLDQLGLLTPGEAARYLSTYPYFRKVFVLPPWQRIYATDDERDQSFQESVRVHDALCAWYVRCGYELVEVPRGPVEERCDFVLATLDPFQRRPDHESTAP
jgi:predicted ATPase